MAESYIEIICCGKDGNAYKTGLGYQAETNAATLAEYRHLQKSYGNKEKGRFIFDYHNAKGDLIYTFCVDNYWFHQITGQNPKSDIEYQAIDRAYWTSVKAEFRKMKAEG